MSPLHLCPLIGKQILELHVQRFVEIFPLPGEESLREINNYYEFCTFTHSNGDDLRIKGVRQFLQEMLIYVWPNSHEKCKIEHQLQQRREGVK